jgi:ATP-dependent Clp protease protease subunit
MTLDLMDLTQEDLLKMKTIAEINKFRAEEKKSLLDSEKVSKESLKLDWDIKGAERHNRDKESEKQYSMTYTFNEEVSQKTVGLAMSEISQWARRDEDMPLDIVLNSPGGAVLDGLALYDFLRLMCESRHVTVTALGKAASMGSVILQAGSERIMGANAWLLIHEVSKGAIGNVSELKAEAEFADSLWKNLSVILSERSTLSALQIRNKAKNKDWWLTAPEALKLGFIDRIV